VDVQVEEADLGVGDLRQRVTVDADELEERDERQAGGEGRRDPAQQGDGRRRSARPRRRR
jgi:hypothetical protein